MQKQSNTIYSHQYPSWLYKHPGLIHLLYIANNCILLRKWYINSAIRKYLDLSHANISILDAGVGEGQYLFPLAHKYPNCEFTGLDKLLSHQRFFDAYTKKFQLTNVKFIHQSIEAFQNNCVYQVIFCFGVLQYAQNDLLVCQHFYRQLQQGGQMFLYVPINNQSILPFFTQLSNRYSNYETVQQRQRIYTSAQLLQMLTAVGFTINECKYTNGYFGIISNELMNIYLMFFNKSHWLFRIVLSCIFILCYPIILLCMLIDYITPKTTGNGLLIIASK